MTPGVAVDVIRDALLIALWTSLPLLLIGIVVGVVFNIVQVATSLQDAAFSTAPRLVAFLAGFLILLPWMLSKLMNYTTHLLGDFSRYAR
jgi:flagellar biosynthetic protein FliQ